MNIASQVRHYLTFLAGLGGLFFSWLIIAPDQVDAVNKAGADLINPLVIIIGAVAAGVTRLLIGWVSSLFSRGAGGVGKRVNGLSWWTAGIISTAAILGGSPSCTPQQMEAARGIPVKGCVQTDQGTVCYSSKGGLSYEVDVRSSK